MTGILYSYIFVQVLVGFHFLMPLIFYVLKVLRGGRNTPPMEIEEADYAVIITAYQQVTLIPMVVDSVLKTNYTNYLIYLVADNCDVSELKFDDERIVVLRPESVLASNTKSHFYAIDRFKREHKYLTIIDSDNLVHEAYFNELNKTFAKGYLAVQGVRKAKNLDTTYACLDEAGDIFYRLIDRKLMFEAGSSAALSGSGMAFTTELYKQCLLHNQFKGAGFDKILQYEILSAGQRIAFSETTVVYDEKTAKTDQLVNQRARWINTWFRYLFLGTRLLGKSVIRFNLNQFLFSVMLLRPPLFMLLMLSGVFMVFDLVFMPYMALYWLFSWTVFFISVFIALAYFKADERIYKSLKNAPRFIYFQILALLKVKKANQLSVATQHYHKEKINEQTNEK